MVDLYDIKEDWGDVKKRWEAWWSSDIYDRPLLLIPTAKRAREIPPELEGFRTEETDMLRKWTDASYLIQRTLMESYGTFYGGEAIPVFNHNWAVGHAVALGCVPHFAQDTIWTDPLPVEPGRDYPEIVFDEGNEWWKLILEVTEKVCVASERRYFVMPMWGNNPGDNLLMCRGSQTLMFDLLEDPGWVKGAVELVTGAFQRQIAALRELTPLTGLEGGVNYVGCWSPGKTLGFDCDLSCMISPGLFREVFLEPLVDTMRTVDHRIYHLDGTVALHQLDTLLSVDEITAFQWVPGAGREKIMQWTPLINKMQASGKSVLVYTSPDEVLPLLKEVSPEGLCIQTYTSGEDEAKKLIDSVSALF